MSAIGALVTLRSAVPAELLTNTSAIAPLTGFISEKDCLKLLSSRIFHGTPSAHVSDYMTRDVTTIGPGTDIYTIAGIFLRNDFRRLPVVEDGRVLGQVSRRNVLLGMEAMRKAEDKKTRYPDYREPQF